jgi:hypothetical protein
MCTVFYFEITQCCVHNLLCTMHLPAHNGLLSREAWLRHWKGKGFGFLNWILVVV